MDWRGDLRALIERVPDEELPDLVGELRRAELEAEIRARRRVNGESLRAFTATEAAEKLGRDVSWVRRHADALGAVRADGAADKLGRRKQSAPIFPEAALQRFLRGG